MPGLIGYGRLGRGYRAAMPPPPTGGQIVIDTSARAQKIIGFGSSQAWPVAYTTLHAAVADKLYSPPPAGIGQSFYNFPIGVDGSGNVGPNYQNSTWSTNLVGDWSQEQAAVARGCKRFCVRVWTFQVAAPWSWQAGAGQNGALNTANYGDAATALTTCLTNATTAGVPIQYLSIMNEADQGSPTYPQIPWTQAQGIDFINNHLVPQITAWLATSAGRAWQALTGLASPIIMWGETADWGNLASWIGAIETDAGGAVGNVGVYATHQYFGAAAHAPPSPCSHPVMCTEYYPQGIAWDTTMSSAMTMLDRIDAALTTGKSCGYAYWWAQADNQESDSEGLLGFALETEPEWDAPDDSKRRLAFGHYSAFVPPDSIMIDVASGLMNVPSGVVMHAFLLPGGANDMGRTVSIVCVNKNASPVSISPYLKGIAVPQLAPWLTDASNNMVLQTPIPTTGAGSSFAATLAPTSATTFVY